MKKHKKMSMMMAALGMSFLAACNVVPEADTNEAAGQADEQVLNEDYSIEQVGEAQYYQPLIDEDGNYPVSQNRGTTARLNSNINMKLFEDDLIRLAQDYFSVDDHYFQEGQYITSSMASSWVGRQSEDNPDGLNPEDDEEPLYLSSVLEHDYYQLNENNQYELAGMTIGLAMNSVDESATPETDISEETISEQGMAMADTIISQVRTHEDIPEDMPIMVGIFEQASSDDLSGGTYIQQGISQSAEAVDEWDEVNENRLVFPIQGGDTPEGNNFRNFQSQVESFFPNLNGIVGRAHYVNDILIDLNITVTTQFYGLGEIVAFTHYLNQAAMTYLPENIRIEIIVESLNGVESTLIRETNESEFRTHVFN